MHRNTGLDTHPQFASFEDMETTETRPNIETLKNSAELNRWYWLKSELVDHARRLGLKTTGAKFTLLDRIGHYLDTGETRLPGDAKPRAASNFDWHGEILTPETEITDNYKNTQNVRRFFQAHIGPGFKFNIAFMAWMKDNTGKTLHDAVETYLRLQARAAEPGAKSRIAEHNQFNQYTRDFLADNPTMGLEEVRKYWALKRARPSETGRHVYDPDDLKLG